MKTNETGCRVQRRRRILGRGLPQPARLRQSGRDPTGSDREYSRGDSALHFGPGSRSLAGSRREVRDFAGRRVSKLPSVSGRDCLKALEKAGFRLRRQEGSHIILRRDDPFAQVVVPDHRELDRGTLRAILRGAGISVDEFIAFLG